MDGGDYPQRVPESGKDGNAERQRGRQQQEVFDFLGDNRAPAAVILVLLLLSRGSVAK